MTAKNRKNGALSSLFFSPSMALDEVCLDSCVYTKFGEDDEYCFKGANVPGTTECSVRTQNC